MMRQHGQIVRLIGLLGVREQEGTQLSTGARHEDCRSIDVSWRHGPIDGRADSRLPEQLDTGWRQGVSGHHPLGAGSKHLEMPSGKDMPDCIDLVGENRKLDGLVVESLT